MGEHGAWHLPGTRDQLPPYREIELSAPALRATGLVVETSVDARPRSVADAEADGAARLADCVQRLAEKAERHGRAAQQREGAAARILGGIPWGQPILVGTIPRVGTGATSTGPRPMNGRAGITTRVPRGLPRAHLRHRATA